jgi:transglutaminase-like putative cysteine protease
MSAAGARLPVPRPLASARLTGWTSPRELATPLRLLAFAALAAYVTAAWLAMIIHPPGGHAVVMLIALIAGGTALAWLQGAQLPRRAKLALAAMVALLTVVAGAIAIGLPARLVAPWNWGELMTNLGGGWSVLWNVDYPYDGTLEWTRLVIVLALPLLLGVAGALAFWPARRFGPVLRAIALVLLVGAYGTATTISPPSNPLLHGVVLLLLVWAWLWLPGRAGRDALTGGALIAVAGLLALPIATSLADRSPLVDYRSWGSGTSDVASTESFVWDQSYGPLTWPRVGRTMFQVRSDGAYYWRTAVLDRFDGTSWNQSDGSGDAALQLPQRGPSQSSPARLNPDWIHELTFTMKGLSSNLVVGAGTPLGLPTLEGVTAMDRGLVLPSSQPLSDGETYAVRSYVPDPSPAKMRTAPTAYPPALAQETVITLPQGESVEVPLWGSEAGGPADRTLAQSAYGGVYRLARRVTAGAQTPYDAVSAIETYLASHYRYSEFAPIRHLALRTFLLGARRGYCQHFSGAMALMLRMVGVPARVAAGFSPGRQTSDGSYVVSDYDAHSWVETYFSGIGWVTFDPTPAGTPARSRVSGLGSSLAGATDPSNESGSSKSNPRLHRGAVDVPSTNATESSAHGSGGLIGILGAFGILGIIAAGLLVRGRARRRALRLEDLADAQLREVASALGRVRAWRTHGLTLLSLELRLATEVGPGTAAYVATIRAARYAPGSHFPPGSSLRGVMRRELASGLGPRGWVRCLLAIPPGGPSRRRG